MNREAKKLHMNKNGERKLPQRRDIHGRSELNTSVGADALSVFTGHKKHIHTTN